MFELNLNNICLIWRHFPLELFLSPDAHFLRFVLSSCLPASRCCSKALIQAVFLNKTVTLKPKSKTIGGESYFPFVLYKSDWAPHEQKRSIVKFFFLNRILPVLKLNCSSTYCAFVSANLTFYYYSLIFCLIVVFLRFSSWFLSNCFYRFCIFFHSLM